jgi:hypothetical protein
VLSNTHIYGFCGESPNNWADFRSNLPKLVPVTMNGGNKCVRICCCRFDLSKPTLIPELIPLIPMPSTNGGF